MARAALTPTLNFLRQRRHKLESLRQQDKLILYGALGVFALSVGVAVVFAVYLFSQQQRFQAISQADSQTARTLVSLADEEAQYLIYTTRLSTLAELWPSRGSQQQTLKFLSSVTMPRLSYQQVAFDQKSRLLEFSVVAEDYFALEEFLVKIKSPPIQTQIESFSVGSVQRNDEGKYSFSIEMRLKEQA